MNKEASAALMARVAGVEWEESEWSDGGFGAWVNGIVVDVVPSGDEWRWAVRPSSSRCEWPELHSSGTAMTLRAAKTAAALKAVDADAVYPKIDYA